jgi:hypothetical protein
MSETSSKHFGSIRDDYAFFLQHSTEAEAGLRAYVPHIHGLAMGDESYWMLDFGCGDSGFTTKDVEIALAGLGEYYAAAESGSPVRAARQVP